MDGSGFEYKWLHLRVATACKVDGTDTIDGACAIRQSPRWVRVTSHTSRKRMMMPLPAFSGRRSGRATTLFGVICIYFLIGETPLMDILGQLLRVQRYMRNPIMDSLI